jgi:hypothetical protein
MAGAEVADLAHRRGILARFAGRKGTPITALQAAHRPYYHQLTRIPADPRTPRGVTGCVCLFGGPESARAAGAGR